MSLIQLALLAGSCFGLALACFIIAAIPQQPDLLSALDQLAPARSANRFQPPPPTKTQDRVGVWVMRHAAPSWWSLVPHRDLDMLRIPPHRYYGEKALYFMFGLSFPVVITAMLSLMGFTLPITVPTLASLIIGLLFSFIPDYNVRSDAARSREEFTEALVAYIDLVALELRSGAGTRRALESAAAVGDSWVFKRIGEELGRSRWSGVPPWDGLSVLAQEVNVPELSELCDVMRLAGEEGAAVAHTLNSRAIAMRAATTAREHAKANAVGERMSLPVSALAMVFLVLVATPPFLRILGG